MGGVDEAEQFFLDNGLQLPGPGVGHLLIAGPGEWSTLYGLPGWEEHEIRARVDLVGRKVVVTAFSVEPMGPSEPVALTTKRLGILLRFVVQVVANVWSARSLEELRSARIGIDVVNDNAVDVRAVTTVEEVAEAWHVAHRNGVTAVRDHIASALHISDRTAQRYITKARELGLIPANARSANATVTTDGANPPVSKGRREAAKKSPAKEA